MAKVMVIDNEAGLIMANSLQLNLSNSRGLGNERFDQSY